MQTDKKGERIIVKRKIFSGVFSCLLIISIAILSGCNFGTGNFSPEAVVRQYMVAYAKGDLYSELLCMPDYVIRKFAQNIGLDNESDRRTVAQEIVSRGYFRDHTADVVVHSCSTEYIPVSDYPIDPAEYGMTEEEHRQIKRFAVVKVEYTWTENGVTEKHTNSVRCVQMANTWFILDF